MSQVATEVIGEKEVAADLRAISERARDARPAMRKVRSLLEAANRKQFETSGAYLGESWAQLAPGTLARKARKNQNLGILRATDVLYRSLTGGKGRRTGATRTSARAGTSVWWAVFTRGTNNAGHGASSPPRPIVGLSPRDQRKAVMVVEKWLTTGQVFP